jgi:hypothetical protein
MVVSRNRKLLQEKPGADEDELLACSAKTGEVLAHMKTTLLDKTNLYLVMLADPQLSHGDKVVAAWLLFFHHNSRSGLCFPKTETIGKAIGMRRENVSRHISNLVKAGYLLVRRRFNSSNSYDFVWSRGTREALNEIRGRLKDENIDVTVSSAASDDVITGVCRNHHSQCDDIVSLIPVDNTLNEHGNLTLIGETDRIHSSNEQNICDIDSTSKNESEMETLVSQFLSVYPLEICRNELSSIRRALRQAITKTSFAAIMNGAMSYATQCADREPRYIADPVNWLNGERWVEKDKAKSKALVIAADGRPISTSSRPLSVREKIQRWRQ